MAEQRGWLPILFDCPRTGEKVQGLIAEVASGADDHRYETVSCLACSGIHLVDPIRRTILNGPRDSA